MILIHPPVAKPCEPPGGIAKLAGTLEHHGVKHAVLDANLEGLLSLLLGPATATDRWTLRAFRNRHQHLAALRKPSIYSTPDRYRRSVSDINRLAETAARGKSVQLSLANYQHLTLSPLRSADLRQAARHPKDNPFYDYFKDRLETMFERKQPSIVGFSMNYLSQALSTFAMLGFIRRRWPELTLVVGGGLLTSWMQQPDWQNPFEDLVDHLVAGPGETALLSMLGIPGSQASPTAAYRPAYRLFPLADYLAPGVILPYSASTGCYWNRCAFCPEKAEGNPYVPVPVDRVMEDLAVLVRQTAPTLIHFLDNAVSPALMDAIIKHPPGVEWYGFARANRHLADLEFCRDLKRSGCNMLKLGLESGDQSVLDGEQKGIDLVLASRTLRNLKKVGIAAYVYLLFGTPSETITKARTTLEFTVKHGQEIDFLNLAIFNLPRCAAQAQQFETNMLYEGDLSLYTGFRHPKGWDRRSVRQFLDKEFKRHPVVRRIMLQDPPLFTSNHAAFFDFGF
ncbi:Radical SAM domain protein [Olavius algarvensis Delta 1 endosymbiont]|nr:Radical SAM domain protein [Olavius algarvensis Delta 1 endosymbiont]